MLESISLDSGPRYQPGSQLEGLSAVNFVFGPNGSGKTTITRIIGEAEDTSITSTRPLSEYSVRIFNQDYIREAFAQDSSMPGVFRLEEGAKEKEDKLKRLRDERKNLDVNLQKWRSTLGESDPATGKRLELARVEDAHKEAAWIRRGRLPKILRDNLQKRTSKKDLVQSLGRARSKPACPLPESELVSRAEIAFSETQEIATPFTEPKVDLHQFQTLQELLGESIKSSADVPLRELVDHLSIEDWVHRGMEIVHTHSLDICPFCQRSMDSSVMQSMVDLFDANYREMLQRFEDTSKVVIQDLQDGLADLEHDRSGLSAFLGQESVQGLVERFRSTSEEVRLMIEAKKASPAASLSGPDMANLIGAVEALYKEANDRVEARNQLIRERGAAQAEIRDQVERHIAHGSFGSVIDTYAQEKRGKEEAVRNLEAKIQKASSRIQEIDIEVTELQAESSSIGVVAESINSLLDAVGFQSFSISAANSSSQYQLVREGNVSAVDTLSEGEKTFLTFLYFIHSLEGGQGGPDTGKPVIAVIDDPISSLDSDILFHVSSLIRSLIEYLDVAHGGNREKSDTAMKELGAPEALIQLIILTHNSYFYRDVSYFPTKRQPDSRRFYSLRKPWGGLTVVDGPENEALDRGEYESLWDVIAEAKDATGVAPAYLPNTMRRIAETYFTFTLGGMTRFLSRLSPDARRLARPVLAWTNSGSHVADLGSAYTPTATCQQWIEAFEEIFAESNHGEHYEMMMRGSRRRLGLDSENNS